MRDVVCCSQQWQGVLMSLSMHGVVSLIPPFLFPIIPTHSHTITTPQAVACGSSMGCWSSPHPPLPLCLSVSIPHLYHSCSTPFHPISNCSWQWLGVLYGASVIISLSPHLPSLSSTLPIIIPSLLLPSFLSCSFIHLVSPPVIP